MNKENKLIYIINGVEDCKCEVFTIEQKEHSNELVKLVQSYNPNAQCICVICGACETEQLEDIVVYFEIVNGIVCVDCFKLLLNKE